MHNALMQKLVQALIDGDQATAVAQTHQLQAAGLAREAIITDGIEAAMTQLDARCTVEQFNLLEIMLAGRAVMSAMKVLYPGDAAMFPSQGTIILASLEGDVHDLGKNILKMVLTAKGYRVVDCGKDCPVDRLIATARQEAPLAVGISGLITTVIPQVRQVRTKMHALGLTQIKVMAGGAALKQATVQSLQVDFIGETAFDCLHYVETLPGGAL
ncbi:cobalamin-dependent protein [Candidatus Chloroploca sp. M-50]|uniref:Cobalamin-dependent protein n=1 Tax=Candidatus Chloroploca mongolica TaxID=2528176 RepID=A0ABS4DG15_9CHLR|nr:cobalamin-dependent protein [Candidatus Chloroploca mongolica]MBP1468386.1 cobalamin-dependent protein [Candidatus Chloroploca mongolica]